MNSQCIVKYCVTQSSEGREGGGVLGHCDTQQYLVTTDKFSMDGNYGIATDAIQLSAVYELLNFLQ